jgi:predicted TIM-barrel fold metal-dependent hydrolase
MNIGKGFSGPAVRVSQDPVTGIAPGRRLFLGGLTALGAGALLPGCAMTDGKAVADATTRNRVDVHHHFVSPGYSAALKQMGQGHAKWSLQMSLDEMDRSGIQTSLLSLVQPAMAVGDVALGRKMAREANEHAARIATDHAGRFGSFAALPYTDTEGSLAEINYALDVLKAEGFCLMTSYGGRYLGDPAFWPVLEELNRRKAVVYTHPLSPQCCGKIGSAVPVATIEYAVDTTRTMASLMFTGAAARFPDIKWIFSHSGGVTPFLVSRFDRDDSTMKGVREKLPNGVRHELAKFYYDMAQGNHPGALDALLYIAPVSQFLYGTDYPFRDGAEVNQALAKYQRFTAAERRAIDRDNALRLMPSLRRS